MNKIEIVISIIAATITIIAGVGGFVYWILNKVFKKGEDSQRVGDLEIKVNAYEMKRDECKMRIAGLESDSNAIVKRIDAMQADVSELKSDMSYMKGRFDAVLEVASSWTQSKSPISLTDEGERVMKELEIGKTIDENWERIQRSIKGMNIKNPYDIQQYCIETASVNLNWFFPDEKIEMLKRYAFKNGISLFSFGRPIGVMIRDRYLAEIGIDIEDVDIYDPNNQSD